MSASPRSFSGARRSIPAALADPRLMASLWEFVRARVPRGEADDIVQAALADALAAEHAPAEDDEVAAWIHGIARYKIVDHFRRTRRESLCDPAWVDAVDVQGAPHGAHDLLRWAERELPGGEDDQRTFEWMLREGQGEKLAAIAADEQVPAPRVRQRVFRLRKHFRARRTAEIAALALLLGIATLVFLVWSRRREPIAPLQEPTLPPSPSLLELPSPVHSPPVLPALSTPTDGGLGPVRPVPSATTTTAPMFTSRPGPTTKPAKAGRGNSIGTSELDAPAPTSPASSK